jgi:hypothetical protein
LIKQRATIVNTDIRACIAYAAGRGISGKSFSGVFDYSQSKQIAMSTDKEKQKNS